MGTETVKTIFLVSSVKEFTVKLNNPLMGTETVRLTIHN